ncbi:hypothetical protein BDN72DRAFT_435492 [Pluteus cervinus]|uniref:Uncharacterized protein n=1 Tax=Pluteus cervinus TaxID=181527 RepID=A0ACD3A7D8_9AGAR|nr:hypothetical protein BDN72DRAFT_435492 [Pluteus cervinus]
MGSCIVSSLVLGLSFRQSRRGGRCDLRSSFILFVVLGRRAGTGHFSRLFQSTPPPLLGHALAHHPQLLCILQLSLSLLFYLRFSFERLATVFVDNTLSEVPFSIDAVHHPSIFCVQVQQNVVGQRFMADGRCIMEKWSQNGSRERKWNRRDDDVAGWRQTSTVESKMRGLHEGVVVGDGRVILIRARRR